MTLNELIVSALERLERGTDNNTIDHYRAEFTDYANTAVELIARKYMPVKKETVELSLDSDGNRLLNLDSLSRDVIKIVDVRVNGSSVGFEQDADGSGEFIIDTTGDTAVVLYRFLPQKLSNPVDVPELPKHMHMYIKYYIVASARCGGDPYTQNTSSADFQMFNQFLYSLESVKLGQASAYVLKNY